MKEKTQGRTGRPRAFDRDAALEIAMTLFWRHGFEGVSIAQLTDAMGIAPASLYGAFGCKAKLYEEALVFYQQRRTARLGLYLEEQNRPIRAILHDMLQTAVEVMTDPACERGCMISGGMLFCAPENARVAQVTANIRRRLREKLAQRLRQAIAVGEMAGSTDADDLSRYVTSLMYGMSVQARDGASREELSAVAELGLANVFGQSAIV